MKYLHLLRFLDQVENVGSPHDKVLKMEDKFIIIMFDTYKPDLWPTHKLCLNDDWKYNKTQSTYLLKFIKLHLRSVMEAEELLTKSNTNKLLKINCCETNFAIFSVIS